MSPEHDPAPLAPASTGRGGEGLGKKVFAASLLGALVFAALSFYGDARAVGASLLRFEWWTFALGLGLATTNYALRFARWQYYLGRIDVHVPLASSARIFVAGFVMSVTPGKLGEVIKSVLLEERHGVSIARTAPIVFAERLTDLFALAILGALGSLVFDRGGRVALIAGAVVLAMWLVCVYRPLGERCLAYGERMPMLRRLAPKLREAYESLHTLVGWRALAAATGLALASWFLECVTLLVIARGFGVTLGLAESVFAYSIPTIVGALAMMPGGLGVTEAGMTGVLLSFGGAAMTPPHAAGITMLVRIATLWWAVGLGVIALALHRRAAKAGLALANPWH